jgi:radical SAM protein with 4Fe4S-binding SPASM domain
MPQYSIGRYYPTLELDADSVEQWNERHVMNIPECRDCRIATFCGGGCAYAAMVKYNCTRRPVCDNAPQVLSAFVDMIKDDIVAKSTAIREGREQSTSNLDLMLATLASNKVDSAQPKAC